jgi:hypothetical protein
MISLLPHVDRIGQIEMLTTYLRRQFGKRPQGCWIPCLAWEQNMVNSLNACGMGYTFLDETQFAEAGAPAGAGSLYNPCITEDQGKLVTVFPIAGRLSRSLGTGSVQIFEELLSLPEDRDCLVTVFPPGLSEEGSSDGAELMYYRFFEELSGLDPRVEFTTPGRIFKTLKVGEKFYFPGTWGVDLSGAGTMRRSRQFLVDYPEANGVYTKTIYTRMLINQLRGDKSRKRTAMEELWKAQDARVFCPSRGLLYRSWARKAAYRALLEAERITRERGSFTPSLSVFDIDLDGAGEYLFQDEDINWYIKSEGACIYELDYLKKAWNYLDTLYRPEGPQTPGRRIKRSGFMDWLFTSLPGGPESLDGFCCAREGNFDGGQVYRFCGGEDFEALEVDRTARRVRFRLNPGEGAPDALEMEKTYTLKKNSILLDYRLRNRGKEPLNLVLVPSLDISFPGDGERALKINAAREGPREAVKPGEGGKLTVLNIRTLAFKDVKNETLISLDCTVNFDARIVPVRARVGEREEYESTCVLPILPLALRPAGAGEETGTEDPSEAKLRFVLKISS